MKLKIMIFLLAFLQYEVPDRNGMSKICVYESYKGQHTLVLKSWEMCPQSIQVD